MMMSDRLQVDSVSATVADNIATAVTAHPLGCCHCCRCLNKATGSNRVDKPSKYDQAITVRENEPLKPPLTTEQQRSMILSLLTELGEDVDRLVGFLRHVDFDIDALGNVKDLPEAWLGHYHLGQGTYDIDRASHDLLTWPPISARIFQLQTEQHKGLPHDL